MIGMMPQKKNIASLIIGSSDPKSGEVSAQSEMNPGLDAAADKFFKAVETKDKGLLIAALQEAFMMIGDEMEMSDLD